MSVKAFSPVSGNGVIDQAHAHLAHLVGEAASRWRLGCGEDRLVETVRLFREELARHCAVEETIMHAMRANDEAAHRAEHAELLAAVDRLLDDIAKGGSRAAAAATIDTMERILFEHEVVVDGVFLASLRSRAAAQSAGVLLPWTESLSVGIDVIDAHHFALVNALNDLHEAWRSGAPASEIGMLLRKLHRLALHHFAEEERLLAGQPGVEEHADHHRLLLGELDRLGARHEAAEVDAGSVAQDFLQYWVLDHILRSDRPHFQKLKS
ncbi:MAG: hypothetical protein HQL41_08335 [Alphaproteobacteria bacterium]|nr:hypothetical protein [Alphaproteobacteria bacterium]